jgi:hypothetical protein
MTATFAKELEALINKYSQENGSDTPDFILAQYLSGCLILFGIAVRARSRWYGHHDQPGQSAQPTTRESDK